MLFFKVGSSGLIILCLVGEIVGRFLVSLFKIAPGFDGFKF